MKGLNLFLAACFVVPSINGAMAANTKRTAISRTQDTPTRSATSMQTRGNTATRNTVNKNLTQRTNQTTQTEKSRVATSRNYVPTRNTKKPNITVRQTALRPSVQRSARLNGKARTATTTLTRESVMQRDFSKCKTVFFDCMDEFCANKDAQLKRCACSGRSNEFRATQKSLDNVEDKLLDFSQRLLKVNMDPSDAAVINQETAGEKAYRETKDKTASKKTLDSIAQKLNIDFNSAGNNMSALSWSLNTDSAFDSVDSITGISTTAKSGIALRNAALPICQEMAAEVCSADDISLVENSYNMAIEQDCNIVKRAYETQTQAARTKILESSALLDMTRLNDYQDNNSDDILTCKSKMLEMLTNTNVCGENLTKCLDISGRYINPTTGEAFLSPDLVNLSNLITRPHSNETWAKSPQNASFVSYLNTKKKYLDSATKNCQTVANDVWDDFIEDALAQIKLAQNAKLEEVRQSCTTLLADCLDNAKQDLSEFDSRALSTFGVWTDKTANSLCENIRKSCSVVVDYDVNTGGNTPTWSQGVTDISAQETYNAIISTCREVGRDCIINSCKSITGNFGLCESIKESVNRHSILTRAACWDQVYNCVKNATDESVENIHNLLPTATNVPQDMYQQMYGNSISNVYDTCDSIGQCEHTANNPYDPNNAECYKCRIAEQIWGNCKLEPNNRATNNILIPQDPNTTTLLSWFAKNTHTENNNDSCSVSICPVGQYDYTVETNNNIYTRCVNANQIVLCNNNVPNILCEEKITIYTNLDNCCPTNKKDSWGNCCMNNHKTNQISHTTSFNNINNLNTAGLCTPASDSGAYVVAAYVQGNETHYLLCNSAPQQGNSPNVVNCDGTYFEVINYHDNNTSYYYYASISIDTTTSPSGVPNYNANYYINADPNGNSSGYCPDSNNTQPNLCAGAPDQMTIVGTTTPGAYSNSCGVPGDWLVKF